MIKFITENASLSKEEHDELNLYAYGLEYYWRENITRISPDQLTYMLFDIHEERLNSSQSILELTYSLLIKLNENEKNYQMVSHLRNKKEQNATSSLIKH